MKKTTCDVQNILEKQGKTTSQSRHSAVEVIKKILPCGTKDGAKQCQWTKGEVFYSTPVSSPQTKIVSAEGAE